MNRPSLDAMRLLHRAPDDQRPLAARPADSHERTGRPIDEQGFGHVKHKVLRRLIAYWLDKRLQRIMPSRGDIDPVDIPWALEWIWLCDYQPTDRRFRFRLAGERVNDFWGSSIAGRYLDEIVPKARVGDAGRFYGVASDGPAIVHDVGRLFLQGKVFATGERIILPLSDDGRGVTGLLGASCRDWYRHFDLDGALRSLQCATVTPLCGDGQSRRVDRSTLNFTP
jgi:hypothetical protein